MVIVDRADELNQNAANALLKALEEPPPKTLFLLISSAEGRLPVTIRSRARTLRVSALGEEDLDKGGARRSRSRRAGGRRQDARHRACSERRKRAPRARARLERGHRALRRDRRRARRACPRSTARGCIAMVERLAGMADTERLDLYLCASAWADRAPHPLHGDGRGGHAQRSRSSLSGSFRPPISPFGRKPGRRFPRREGEAFALNLDRSLLVLDTWFRLQSVAREHPV